jgi:uncharacterized protein (UPF0261 family)
MKTVAIVGTLDTKGVEFEYMKQCIERTGVKTLVIDIGMTGKPSFKPDIPFADVVSAGGGDPKNAESLSKSDAFGLVKSGIGKVVAEQYAAGKIDALITMGGGQGSILAVSALTALPIGVPKMLISTMPGMIMSNNDVKDAYVVNSLVDIAGLNSLLTSVIMNAAASISSMVQVEKPKQEAGRQRISATMYGVTTKCVDMIRAQLEKKGFEVLPFHANGTGGPLMEEMIRTGYINAVLDITTAEIVVSYNTNKPSLKTRLEAAGEMGLPQVVSFGGLDRINVAGPIPEKYNGRVTSKHNPQMSIVRTSIEENEAFGRIIAEKLNKSKGKTAVVIPLGGISSDDIAGNPFHDAQANKALFDSLKKNLKSDIPVIEIDGNINGEAFAAASVTQLLDML